MLVRAIWPVGALVSALALSSTLCGACAGEGSGRPDEELADLVVSPPEKTLTIDLNRASTDAAALLEAARMPHAWVADKLGAHVVRATSTLKLEESAETVEEFSDQLLLDFDGEGRFLATLDNSKEYGRHAIYDGKTLYLRPRFGIYHARAPQSEGEEAEIRNKMYGVAGDYLELLSRQLEVSDKGSTTSDGRAAREVALKMAPTARALPPESLSQRKWRDTIEVKSIKGTAVLDAESGVLLHLTISGSIAFERDKRRFTMTLGAESKIEEIGHTRAIEAPPEDLVMAIAPRRRELAERDALLNRIAPPARSAPVPSDPSGDK